MTKKQDEIEKRIAHHAEKLKQAKAQKQALDARQKQKERKEETRAKIILGGLALKNATLNDGGEFTQRLLHLVQEYTTDKEHELVMKYVDKALGRSEQAELETVD